MAKLHGYQKKILGGIMEYAAEHGIKTQILSLYFDPEIERGVRKYVMLPEEAHRKAAHSKLHFGYCTA